MYDYKDESATFWLVAVPFTEIACLGQPNQSTALLFVRSTRVKDCAQCPLISKTFNESKGSDPRLDTPYIHGKAAF
jgi:hypothetical protein